MCKEPKQNDQSNFENKNLIDDKKFQLEKIYQFLENEINLQEKRVWFFGALITALLTAWYYTKKDNENFSVILPFIAFVISLIQCFLNRGSKYWLNYWGELLKKDYHNIFKYENNVDKTELFKNIGFLGAKRKVKIPMLFIFFADFVCLNCFLLFGYELFYNNKNGFNCPLLIFLIINIIVIGIAFISKPCKWKCKKLCVWIKNRKCKIFYICKWRIWKYKFWNIFN